MLLLHLVCIKDVLRYNKDVLSKYFEVPVIMQMIARMTHEGKGSYARSEIPDSDQIISA